jgi:hypothetical protein
MAVATGNDGEGTIWLLETATGKVGKHGRALWASDGHAYSVAFAADGRTLAADRGKETRLWDLATGEVLQTIQGGALDGRNFALAPDGRTIVQGDSGDGVIRLYQTATGKELRTLQGDRAGVHAVAFSPDGKNFASTGTDQAIKLWDVATGRQLWLAEGHKGLVSWLSFSPDGKTLTSGGTDLAVRLWEVTTGKERWRFEGHRNAVRCGAFSRDGKLLATGSADTTVLVWDLAFPAGPPRLSPLSARELDALWADLAGEDARRAYQAIGALAEAVAQAVPFLQDHVKVVPLIEDPAIGRLLADLDSERFATRAKAMRQLQALAATAEPALRKALARRPTVEVHQRVNQLLEKLDPRWSPEVRRQVRAVEVLTRIGSREARQVLERLAGGAPEVRLTQEAKASLDRLAKRPLARP